MRHLRFELPTLSTLATLLLIAGLAVGVPVLGLEPSADAAPRLADDGDDTEDVLYMNDGRELRGRILEEKGDAIVFQLIDRSSNIKTKLTFLLEEIDSMERGVPLAVAPEPETRRRRSATSQPAEEPKRTYGSRRAEVTDENVPSFYVIPMKGQMGTDINTEVYRLMVEDIREQDPDVMVIKMECRDVEDALYSLIGREEEGQVDFDEFRKMLDLFRDEMRDIRQVMWIQDSVGVSSAVALAWDELYMAPEARLGGMEVARMRTGFDGWSDDDVRGKMTAAFMSWVKGFLEYGEYALVLADAMMRPEFSLSGTWKGREVEWSLDDSGEYIVDARDDATVSFRAKDAENLCISDGTAENLDDLALLLGIREYRTLDAEAERIFDDYSEDWRRAFENCETWLADYNQFMGWATGADALKYMGQAKNRLEKVVSTMERYKPVETRLGMRGVRRFELETQIEVMKERIRGLRQGNRARGGGRRGGGSGVGR